MTTTNFNFNSINSTPTQAPKKRTVRDFFNKHRLLGVSLFVAFFILLIIIASIFLMNAFPKEPKQEPEDAPYLTYENKAILDQTILGEILQFNLSLILLRTSELESAPTNNNNSRNYIVSVTEDSHTATNFEQNYKMSINLSDGRKYSLQTIVHIEYQNEYALAILDRIDKSDGQDYIIAFTNNTSEYYLTLGTSNTSSADSSSSIKDHITGAPLVPLPETATKWLDSLHLTNPEYIYTTFPSIR